MNTELAMIITDHWYSLCRHFGRTVTLFSSGQLHENTLTLWISF